jgi:lysophospholipase L1-like esterase
VSAQGRRRTKEDRILKKLASSLALSIAAVVVALLVIEIVLRIAAPGENIPQREYDPHLGWRGRPNLECVLNEGHFRISISQNSRGFRDVERPVGKPPGTKRILCLGDSFTWGWGVEQDEIYTTVLGRRYAEAGTSVEVLNAGVGGYSTDQLLLYLEREGFSYSPDSVVYQAAWNDVRDNPRTLVEAIYNKPAYDLEADGNLVLRGSPVPPLGAVGRLKYLVSRHSRFAYFLKHRLHLARFAREAVADQGAEEATGGAGARSQTAADIEGAAGGAEGATPAAEGRGAATTPAGPAEAGYPFRLFCALVAEMDAVCGERGTAFVTLIDFEVSDLEMDHWERACGHVEVRFVDRYLRARETADAPAYIPNDGHWTADGHRWIAELLHEDVLAAWSHGR